MKAKHWRDKLEKELKEFLSVFLGVAPFFLAFVTYHMWLSGDSSHEEYEYGTALLNALVLSKIILIGELAGLGRRSESRPLIVSTIHKSLFFTLFYMAFHALENLAKARLDGHSFSSAIHAALVQPRTELIGRALVMFFAFLPFFALREVRRVMGPERFTYVFIHGGTRAVPNQSRSDEHGEHAA
jgi:hypothetical protein